MAGKLDDIIKGCRKGNRRCQEELYHLLSPSMYAVCLRYASDADEAADFLQEGFIRVFTRMGSYRGDGPFEGWVRKIMVNTALQFLRKKRQMIVLREEITEDPDFIVSDTDCGLEHDDLIKMVMNLPDNQRMVFNLFVIEGYNHAEISELTGMPENTCKSHLHRARVALKEMIKMYSVSGGSESKKTIDKDV